MDELTSLIRKVPADYDWLLRNGVRDEPGAFFCHVTHMRCWAQAGVGMVGGPSSKHWADTPEEALALCLQQLEIGR